MVRSIFLMFSGIFAWKILLICPSIGIAQTQGYYDSLELARSKMDEKKLIEAFEILDQLEKQFPGEENLIRIKGQALYWSQDFELTKSFFRTKISSFPDLQWIKLDYGRILYELHENKEAKGILDQFLAHQPEHPEANQMMATLNYWVGQSPKKSYDYLEKILIPFPDNPSALELQKEIREGTSPFFKIITGYFSDSQPLQFFNFQQEGSFYLHSKIQPGYSLNYRNYSNGINVFSIQAWNKIGWTQTGTPLLLRGGMASSSIWDGAELTFGGVFSQRISKDIELRASVDREAYFYTLASLQEKIIPLVFRAELGREVGSTWTGKVLFQRSNFEDNNSVQTISFWGLYSLMNQNLVRIDLGYAFMTSDSEEVRFEPNQPILNRPNNTAIGEVIPGSYTPYFTPIHQQVHGLLAKLNVNFSGNVKLAISGNVGVYAEIDNPNTIYYGGPGVGNAPIKPSDIFLELFPTRYNPMDLSAEITCNLSSGTSLKMQYTYQKTIFFESNAIQAGLNFRIWND